MKHWVSVVALTGLAVYGYGLAEWLFFMTKPSFLSSEGFFESLLVLLSAPFPLVLGPLAFCALLAFVGLLGRKKGRFGDIFFWIACLIPGLILGALFLILLDNFTLSLAGFGIRSARHVWRIIYAGVFLGLVGVSAWLVGHGSKRWSPARLAAGLAVLLTLSGLLWMRDRGPEALVSADASGGRDRQPNIFLISSDGVESSHLSIYGYERETTPFLRGLFAEGLICENAFPNGSSTAASLVSLLTSKRPTATRLIYPPDILKGRDAFEHLPAILRLRGYRSLQLSIRHYADAFDSNLRNSFDIANGRESLPGPGFRSSSTVRERPTRYFLDQAEDRIRSRLLHIFLVKEFRSAFDAVADSEQRFEQDRNAIRRVLRFLDESPGPYFVQVHFMGTHGQRFRPYVREFSAGEVQDQDWMTDFYDDAILSFDRYVREVADGLAERNLLEDTVFIVTSDHARRYSTRERIPLLFRFPGGEHAGRIRGNVQLIDVAPTILDYLDVEIPGWMQGVSILEREPAVLRPVFSAVPLRDAITNNRGLWIVDPARAVAPFYSLAQVGMILCHRSYVLSLRQKTLEVTDIEGYADRCGLESLPGPAEARAMILGHLAENGYDDRSFFEGDKAAEMPVGSGSPGPAGPAFPGGRSSSN